MAGINRYDLNERFKTLFYELEKREEIVKNSREKSKTAFAKKIGTKGHIIDAYLDNRRKITYEQAKRLCEQYKVSEVYMFQGEGAMFETTKQLPTPDDRLAMILNIDFPPNILFTNVEAFSSNTLSVDLWEENERFRIPGVIGDLVAFNINGNSMFPTINSGDMVICEPLASKESMKDNTVYAVVTNQSVWVKRVQRCFDRYGRWTHLKLISDNKVEFDPFLVEVGEIRRLLQVKKRLTGINDVL